MGAYQPSVERVVDDGMPPCVGEFTNQDEVLTVFAALKQKLFGTDTSSKGLAKSRLHFVLVNDRTGLTGDEMAQFKRELVSVIERFFEINPDGFDVSYKREEGMTTLLINSPVLVRRKEIGTAEAGKNGSAKRKKSGDEATEGQSAAEA